MTLMTVLLIIGVAILLIGVGYVVAIIANKMVPEPEHARMKNLVVGFIWLILLVAFCYFAFPRMGVNL